MQQLCIKNGKGGRSPAWKSQNDNRDPQGYAIRKCPCLRTLEPYDQSSKLCYENPRSLYVLCHRSCFFRVPASAGNPDRAGDEYRDRDCRQGEGFDFERQGVFEEGTRGDVFRDVADGQTQERECQGRRDEGPCRQDELRSPKDLG